MKDEMDGIGGTYVAAKKCMQNASQKTPREVNLGDGIISKWTLKKYDICGVDSAG
jgi:hypothetical protein